MFAALRRTFTGGHAHEQPHSGHVFERDHALSQNPDFAWRKVEPTQRFELVPMVDPNSAVPPHHTRFVLISDTHTRTDELQLPAGDVLIHAGDFSDVGLPHDIEVFAKFIERQPHQTKIVIAGNHDVTFDTAAYPKLYKRFYHKQQFDSVAVKQILRDACVYLEDEECQVNGFRIWGSPWQPEFGGWAFNLERGEACDQVWEKIPDGIDVLVTHGPPLGRGDLCRGGDRAGCFDLLRHVQQRVKPMLHVFGHIHEAYGVTSDGHTIYANASTCTYEYRPLNPPIVIDLPNK